jgi:YgiT-type zinc finger domain-containing protein
MNTPAAPPELCPLCGGTTGQGETVFAVELGTGVAVVRHVPARVCTTCGESWIDDDTAAKLEQIGRGTGGYQEMRRLCF